MNRTILVVEDNATDEKLMLLAFKKSQIAGKILVERDGAAALAYLFSTGEHAEHAAPPLPRVVLLDLKLPKIDGLEVLRRIREDTRTKALPVVVMTASRQDEDVLRSYALGANAYVRKPVEFADFTAAVTTLGEFWLSLNEVLESAPIPP